jgi:hypothetical protein
MADRVAGKLVVSVADMLRDARAGILQDTDAAEEGLPQRAVPAQPRDQFLVTLRDVRVEQRRDFAQVTDRLLDLTGQGLAVIDIKRPPIVQGDTEADRAAEDVIPGQPIDEDGSLFGEHGVAPADHLHDAAQRTIRADHAFRHPGRTGGEQQLGHRIGLDRLGGRLHRIGRRRGDQRIEQCRAAAGIAARDDDLGILRGAGTQCRRILIPVVRKDQARLYEGCNVAQPGKVGRGQGIGRRHRYERNSHSQAGERQQTMLDSIAGQDKEGPREAETAVEQGLPDRASGGHGFQIGDFPPAFAVTAGEKHAIWCLSRPVLQALDQAVRIGAKRRRVADQQATVRTRLEYRLSPRHWHRSRHDGLPSETGTILGARLLKKAASRSLASSSPMAMADIRLSIMKPPSALARAMRGSA